MAQRSCALCACEATCVAQQERVNTVQGVQNEHLKLALRMQIKKKPEGASKRDAKQEHLDFELVNPATLQT